MEIMNVDRIAGGTNTILVGLTVGNTRLHASSGHPGREYPMMMFPTFRIGRGIEWGSAKLGGPHDKGILQHAPLLEVT